MTSIAVPHSSFRSSRFFFTFCIDEHQLHLPHRPLWIKPQQSPERSPPFQRHLLHRGKANIHWQLLLSLQPG
jgi:hypothetical protein